MSFSFSPLIRTAQSDVSVKCRQNDMSITLPKALLLGLKRKHITLQDVNCVGTETETHYRLTTALIGCGTQERRSGLHQRGPGNLSAR